jgi:hypothetical protein
LSFSTIRRGVFLGHRYPCQMLASKPGMNRSCSARPAMYVTTIEDPTVWTRPWTVKQEFTKQSEEENRTYYEPRCIEGNYGLPGCCMDGA